MITELGKPVMLRSLANAGPSFGEHMVFGVGDTAVEAGDTSLDFEMHRASVDLLDYDDENNRIIYRGSIPDQKYFELHEVGMLVEDSSVDTESPSQVITLFDGSSEEEWSGFDALETTGIRTGTGAYRLDDGGTLASDGPIFNFASADSTDVFSLAYNLLSGTAGLTMRLVVDGTNYRELDITPTSGFNVAKFLLSDFVTTGTAPLDEINSVEFVVTGTNEFLFEGLRSDNNNAESDILVARTVLTTPVQKSGVVELQVEYRVGVEF